MGRHKRGFNSLARDQVKVKLVDQQEVDKLRGQVNLEGQNNKNEDDSNALVLPSKKRKVKIINDNKKVIIIANSNFTLFYIILFL